MKSISRPLYLLSFVLLAVLTLPFAARAQTPAEPPSGLPPASGSGDDGETTVRAILEGDQRPLLRLAFPDLRNTPGMASAILDAGRELEKTLRADLEASKIFDIQGQWALEALNLTGDRARDFEQYRSLGNEIVLLGQLRQEGSKLVFEGRVYDLASKQSILGKRYRGEADAARRIAHTFADELVRYFTGRPGVALTKIAFYSDRTGEKEIYLMDYDGANQRRFSGHKSVSLFPSWSPTADGIAYVSFLSGKPSIYFGELPSRQKRPIITDGQLNTSPSFSPDGQRIVFGRSLGGNTEIFVAGRDGSNISRLTHSRAIDTNPSWSPKGAEIAFTSSRGGSPQIYVMDPEGSNVRRISTTGSYNDGASWHPDGTKLVYASRIRGVFQITVTDTVTMETEVLTSGPGNKESPSISPDGRWIVYSLTKSARSGPRTQIWIMDVTGANQRQLTSNGNNQSPEWSPYL